MKANKKKLGGKKPGKSTLTEFQKNEILCDFWTGNVIKKSQLMSTTVNKTTKKRISLTQQKKQFKKSRYIILRNLITHSHAKKLYNYTLDKKILHSGFLDLQVKGSPSYLSEKVFIKLQHTLTPIIEKLTGLKLFSTSAYRRIYFKGAILKMHRDRSEVDYALTLNLGQLGTPWDFWFTDKNENTHRVILQPGDAIFYQGSQFWHWRGKLTDGDLVSQLLFSFVEQHSPFAKAFNVNRVVDLSELTSELLNFTRIKLDDKQKFLSTAQEKSNLNVEKKSILAKIKALFQ